MFVWAVLLFATVLACVNWSIRWQKYLTVTRKVPALDGAWPIIGHAQWLIGADGTILWELFKQKCKETTEKGGVATAWLGPYAMYVITDPDSAHHILNVCLDKSYLYRFFTPWLGDGLFTSDATTWKRHRKFLNPAFGQHILEGYIEVFNRQSCRLVEELSSEVGSGHFDPTMIISRVALQIICETLMGIPSDMESTVDAEYEEHIAKQINCTMYRVNRVWLYPDVMYNLTDHQVIEAANIGNLQRMALKVLQTKKEKLKENNNGGDLLDKRHRKTFLDLMLEHGEQDNMSESEMKNELDTMLAAGFDTTAKTAVILVVVLASHSNVQKKIYNEIYDVFGDSNRDVTKEDLSKLLYIEAVVKECVRLYPVGPLIGRSAHKDIEMKNFTIPAGSGIMVPLWGVSRHKSWGSDADEFRPERWMEPGGIPESSAAFASFSLGKRGCIGKPFALMLLKTTLVHLIRRLRISSDSKPVSDLDLLIKSADCHRISVDERITTKIPQT